MQLEAIARFVQTTNKVSCVICNSTSFRSPRHQQGLWLCAYECVWGMPLKVCYLVKLRVGYLLIWSSEPKTKRKGVYSKPKPYGGYSPHMVLPT